MNPIAKSIHCTTCGSPKGRACHALDPSKNRIVPNHAARIKAYMALPVQLRIPVNARSTDALTWQRLVKKGYHA